MQQTVNRLERAPVLCHMPLKLDVTSTLRWKRGRLQPEKKRGDLSQFVVTALTGELEGVRELGETQCYITDTDSGWAGIPPRFSTRSPLSRWASSGQWVGHLVFIWCDLPDQAT